MSTDGAGDADLDRAGQAQREHPVSAVRPAGGRTVEAVLLAVELVPTGCVVSYGDVAELVGSSPRRVGAIMAQRGAEVAWWRVTDARGALPAHLLGRAVAAWEAEGIEHASGRCRIARHRADLASWVRSFDSATQGSGLAVGRNRC